MKSLVQLWRVVAQDMGDQCCVCTARDLETVTCRVEGEGVSFLTITLPSFANDLDEALSLGYVDHTHFVGFRRLRGTPRFLGGFLDLIFDRNSGLLLDEPSTGSILAVRQLCRLFSKVLLPCTKEREVNALRRYVEIDEELGRTSRGWALEDLQDFSRVGSLLFGDTFSALDNLLSTGLLTPKHGPGATADGLFGNEKFAQHTWHWRLERGGFHSVEFLLPNARYHHYLDSIEFLDPDQEQPVKVTLVPKTLKTPRIIAIEPTCMQYSQQAVAELLVELLEADKISGRFVGFTDQTPNQKFARLGSLDGSLATLDLSDASDRVSNSLVRRLLRGFTNVSDAVEACRSTSASVPAFGVIPLNKYASMGSALCFPIEAMVFTTLCFLGIERTLQHRLSRRDLKSYHDKVRIYGDDMIVPTECAQSVIETLESYGLKVNRHKTFLRGKFRESCGKEYFDGTDVSVVKCRRTFPSSRTDVEEIVSLVSFRNQIYGLGCHRTVEHLDSILVGVLKHFPHVGPDSPLLGRHGDELDVHHTHPHLHRPVSKGWMVRAVSPSNSIDGVGALLKYFLKRGDLPFADKKHLERSGRPLVVSIQLGYGPTL